MRHAAALTSFVLTLVLVGLVAGEARATTSAPTAVARMQPLEQAILEQTNAVRARHGLRALVVSSDLSRAALVHTRSMLQGGFFAHESRDGSSFSSRLKRFYTPTGYSFWTAGENLIYDTGSLDAAKAVDAWMKSPPHRRNMLDPNWREVGIASLHASTAGGEYAGAATTVVTMDFGARTRMTTASATASSRAA